MDRAKVKIEGNVMKREFFSIEEMGNEDIRTLQLKCLDILLYFQKICEKNHLTFYLAGGTAIGALRHKGFIPWDDDIDVFMPRPDYEKLTKIWNSEADTSRYIFCRSTDKINYHHHAASIMDITTTWIEQRNVDSDIPQGIVMDVIPLDGCPDLKIQRFFQLFYAFVFALFNPQRLPENKNKIIYRTTKILLGVVRNKKLRDFLWMFAERKMKKYEFYSYKNITELIGNINGMLTKHPLDDFLTVVYKDFEGYSMPLMKGYDAYLKSIFGDYMKMPPKKQRHPKAKVVYVNFDESYLNYKGIYYLKGKK